MTPTHQAVIGSLRVLAHLDTSGGSFRFLSPGIPLCPCGMRGWSVRKVEGRWALCCRHCHGVFPFLPIPPEP